MNTVEFLLSLKDNHQYFKLYMTDLQLFIDCFSAKMFNINFAFTNIKGEDFLDLLEKDLKQASLEQINTLASIVKSFNEYQPNLEEKPLLRVLNEAIKERMIQNPEALEVKKYYKIIVNTIVFEMQKYLKQPIRLDYNKSIDYYAMASEEYYGHKITFNIFSPNFSLSNRSLIYNIYQILYHELYHCIVEELIQDKDCYKIDILQFQIMHALRSIIENQDMNDKFYQVFYNFLKEESNAELFGIKKAKEEVMKINPNFKISILQKIHQTKYLAKEKNETIGHKQFMKPAQSQDAFFEKALDNRIGLMPECINGHLARMYNSDGVRKDYYTLINDMNEALKESPHNFEDIFNYYYYLIYRIILKMDAWNLEEIVANENDCNIIRQVLIASKERLETELKNIEANKLYFMINFYQDNLNKETIKNEIQRIDNLLKELNLESEKNYERK